MSESSKRLRLPWPVETEKAKEIWKYIKNLANAVDETNLGHADLMQPGVIQSSDYSASAEINGSTGEIKSSSNTGGTAWLPDPVLGTTVLMRSSRPSSSKLEATPPSLPAAGKYMVVGIELTATSWNEAPTVSIVSGTEKATEKEALEHVPAVSSGKLRIRDVLIKNTSGTYSIVSQWDRRPTAEAAFKPGFVQPTALSSAPFGWLFCSGQTVKRAQYPALFAAIGTSYGAGDGLTTFVLPGGEGRTFIGEGNSFTEGSTYHSIGATGGEEKHKLTIAQLAAHSHSMEIKDAGHYHAAASGRYFAEWDSTFGSGTQWVTNLSMSGPETASWTNFPCSNPYARSGTETAKANMSWFMYNEGGGESHNNLPPYFVGNYIIKC